MCHIILFLPVLALPVFWLVPLPIAGTLYLFILLFSAWMYYVVLTVMHQPARVGAETLLNRCGRVIRTQGQQCLIQLGNEIWSARSKGQLSPGDNVRVVSRDGLTLRVSPVTDKACTRMIPGEAASCHGWLHHLRRRQSRINRTQDKSA
ncbi:MAG TPA: NfeD family protein [Gammaproteobacteria bacterium]|nr:NfeD family protein [Gammaproteobacteria bacterium]